MSTSADFAACVSTFVRFSSEKQTQLLTQRLRTGKSAHASSARSSATRRLGSCAGLLGCVSICTVFLGCVSTCADYSARVSTFAGFPGEKQTQLLTEGLRTGKSAHTNPKGRAKARRAERRAGAPGRRTRPNPYQRGRQKLTPVQESTQAPAAAGCG